MTFPPTRFGRRLGKNRYLDIEAESNHEHFGRALRNWRKHENHDPRNPAIYEQVRRTAEWLGVPSRKAVMDWFDASVL